MEIWKTLFCIVLIVNGIVANAQLDSVTENKYDEEIIFGPIEIRPIFPGGDRGLMCFIEGHLDFDLLNSVDTSGLSAYSFTIDTLGYCKFNRTLRSIDKRVDDHMEFIINEFPQWIPGERRGEKISVDFTVPLRLPYTKKWCKN